VMPNGKVSIIMRSKNSDWVIASTLNALFSQRFSQFELTIIDSGSTDNTLNIINQYPVKLIHINPEDYYPGRVLNQAIKTTDSEIIVFINSDSVMLSPNSLGNLLASFDNQNTAAAFGRQIPRPDAHTWVRRDYAISFPEQGPPPPWITFSLPLAAFRREAWVKHNFYTDAWASEDTEWGHWAKANDQEVQYVPSALTMHSHNYTLKQIAGRRFVEGEADAFIYQTRDTSSQRLWEYLKSCIRDITPHLKPLDLFGLMAIPVRRAIYHWSYFRGNRLGTKRINAGPVKQDKDQRVGQRVVLHSNGH